MFKKKIPYIQQISYTECGICCAGMLLGYYGINYSLNELRDYFDVSRDGVDLKQIKDFIDSHGLITKAISCETEMLLNVRGPAIIFWENSHFCFLQPLIPQKCRIFSKKLQREIPHLCISLRHRLYTEEMSLQTYYC